MGVEPAIDQTMWQTAGEADDPFRDSRCRLLASLLADAADCRIPPMRRADLLARFSQLLNSLAGCTEADHAPASDTLHALQVEHERLLHDEVLPELCEQGLAILRWEQMSRTERNQLRRLFYEVIYPLATPLVVDWTHPFPRLVGIPLTVGVFVANHSPTDRFACIPLPRQLFAVTRLDGGFVRILDGRLIGVEVILSALIERLFRGAQVLESATFRVTDAPVRSIDAPAHRGVCLHVEETMSERMLELLVRNVRVGGAGRVYRERAPLALAERVITIPEAHAARMSRHRLGRTQPAVGARRRRARHQGPERTLAPGRTPRLDQAVPAPAGWAPLSSACSSCSASLDSEDFSTVPP